MSALEGVKELAKTAVRQNSAAYEVVRRRRAIRQEREYVERRDCYARAVPAFAPPGVLSRSHALLASRWSPPAHPRESLGDVRIFGAVADDPGGPQIHRPISEAFDAVLFDLARYRSIHTVGQEGSLAWRQRLQHDLLAAFEAAHAEQPVDIFFAYASYTELEPATLNRIRARGVPVVVLCLDDKHLFAEDTGRGYPNGQAPLIGSVDVHLTNSRECVRWYLAEGAAAYYMPQGIDPGQYEPVSGELEIGVSFMGQRYGYRARFIDALRVSGVDVECFGPGWGRVVSHEEKVKIYSLSRINLGIAGVGYSGAVTCIKGRDFEVPAAGGVYLTTYDPELSDLFRIGREIICYRNEIDCVEQIRYYLENEEERHAIGEAGRARTLRDHTWQKRFAALLDWMGITE